MEEEARCPVPEEGGVIESLVQRKQEPPMLKTLMCDIKKINQIFRIKITLEIFNP